MSDDKLETNYHADKTYTRCVCCSWHLQNGLDLVGVSLDAIPCDKMTIIPCLFHLLGSRLFKQRAKYAVVIVIVDGGIGGDDHVIVIEDVVAVNVTGLCDLLLKDLWGRLDTERQAAERVAAKHFVEVHSGELSSSSLTC